MQPTDLLQQLTDDIQALNQLIELLEHEFQALRTRSLEQLQSILDQKQPLLAQLGQHARARAQLLQAKQLPLDRAGLSRCIKGIAEQELCLQKADELEQLLAKCHQNNERNAHFINLNQNAISSMLGIVRGVPAVATGLYDRYGSTGKSGHQRILSQA